MVPGIFPSQLEILCTGLISKPSVNPASLDSFHGFRARPLMMRDAESTIVMTKQASWGALPDAVVSEILWCVDLHFLDRWRCQQVCQTWKSLLRERPSGLERIGLSTELCINFSSTTRRQSIALQLAENPSAIHVVTARGDVDHAASSTFRVHAVGG